MKSKSKKKPNVPPGNFFGGIDPDGPYPDFSIYVTPDLAKVSVPFRETASCKVTITSMNGFSFPVKLGITGLPSHVAYSFNPPSITTTTQGDSTLTITVNPATPLGSFQLLVTGNDGIHSFPVTLSVSSDARIGERPKVPRRAPVKGPVTPPPGGPVEE